jgi:hypothetical protein
MFARAQQLNGDAPVGRRDTARLLASVGALLTPLSGHPTSPYTMVRAGSNVADRYWEHFLQEARSLRYEVLLHAADAIGLDYDWRKMYQNKVWKQASELALRDEAGLLEALRILDGLRRPNGSRAGQKNAG